VFEYARLGYSASFVRMLANIAVCVSTRRRGYEMKLQRLDIVTRSHSHKHATDAQ
jgi:hypothetical protein